MEFHRTKQERTTNYLQGTSHTQICIDNNEAELFKNRNEAAEEWG
jgi:hypothetical protein